MTFDPNEHKPKGERRDNDDSPRLDTAGRYIVAAHHVGSRVQLTSNDTPFVRVFFTVLHGPKKGHWFKEDVYVHERAYQRLGSLCAAVGFKEKFQPDRDVYALARALMHRPFSAKVKTENGNDGERYARIAYSDPLKEGQESDFGRDFMREMKEARAEALEKLKEAIDKIEEDRREGRDNGYDGERRSSRGRSGGGGGGRGRDDGDGGRGGRGRRDDFDDDFNDDIPF